MPSIDYGIMDTAGTNPPAAIRRRIRSKAIVLADFRFAARLRWLAEQARALGNEAWSRPWRSARRRAVRWSNPSQWILIPWAKKPAKHIGLLHLFCPLSRSCPQGHSDGL